MFSAPLLAQGGLPGGLGTIVAVIVVLVLIVFFGFLLLALKYYKRCPSNRILVIYGVTRGDEPAECISGGARFVKPLIQDYAWMSLEPMQIEVPLRGALSHENIRVNVPSVFTVAIGTEPALMRNAAIRLLGLSMREIEKQASEIIFGQLRQVIARMPIEDIRRDHDNFLSQITTNLEPELRKIGLVLINVNVTDITDESGYIQAIEQRAVPRLVAHFIKEDKLSDEDRRKIRSLLDRVA